MSRKTRWRQLAKSVRALGLLAVLCLFTNPMLAAEATAGFRTPHPFAQIWARLIGLSLVSAAALLIIYTLVFRRQRLYEASSKWMLFIGICLLPTPVMFLSTAVGLEQSKNVEFCMSCHVMKPFVDDLKDPTSKTLAALHYKNR